MNVGEILRSSSDHISKARVQVETLTSLQFLEQTMSFMGQAE